jgi:hypothetical protein
MNSEFDIIIEFDRTHLNEFKQIWQNLNFTNPNDQFFIKKFFTSNLRIRSSFLHIFYWFLSSFLKFWSSEQWIWQFLNSDRSDSVSFRWFSKNPTGFYNLGSNCWESPLWRHSTYFSWGTDQFDLLCSSSRPVIKGYDDECRSSLRVHGFSIVK